MRLFNSVPVKSRNYELQCSKQIAHCQTKSFTSAVPVVSTLEEAKERHLTETTFGKLAFDVCAHSGVSTKPTLLQTENPKCVVISNCRRLIIFHQTCKVSNKLCFWSSGRAFNSNSCEIPRLRDFWYNEASNSECS